MNRTIADLVHDLVQARPERRAVLYRNLASETAADDALSYGQLWTRSGGFAQALGDLKPGSHVMLVLPLGTRLLTAHLGALMRGCAASIFTHPSDKMAPEVYRRNLLHAAGTLRPDAIVTAREFVGALQAGPHSVAASIIVADDLATAGAGTGSDWKAAAHGDAAIIQYSSGSTGLQKCVALSHAMVVGQCQSYGRFIGLDPARDTVCSWLPLYHDMGLFTSWLIPVTQGIGVAMIDPFEWVRNPVSLLQLISDARGTLCWQPNFAFRLLATRVERAALGSIDLSTMRGFVNCSEPVSARVMADFRAAFNDAGVREDAMWTCYAMAENAFAVTHSGGPTEPPLTIRVDREHLARGEARVRPDGGLELASCGLPIEGCELRVVSEQRAALPEDRVGEIALRSPYMLREYIRAPALTRQAIDAERWYYSGDLGFLHAGRLFVTGRKKDLLIVAGRNFYPQDIEDIAGQCEGAIAGRAVALGVEDAELGTQQIVVLVESKIGRQDERARLAMRVRREVLEQLDCPVTDVGVVPHMWLLKTSSGKIARQPNLDKYRREHGDAAAKRARAHPAHSDTIPAPASLATTAGWALLSALLLYLYVLIFVLGDSKSWNIYAGF